MSYNRNATLGRRAGPTKKTPARAKPSDPKPSEPKVVPKRAHVDPNKPGPKTDPNTAEPKKPSAPRAKPDTPAGPETPKPVEPPPPPPGEWTYERVASEIGGFEASNDADSPFRVYIRCIAEWGGPDPDRNFAPAGGVVSWAAKALRFYVDDSGKSIGSRTDKDAVILGACTAAAARAKAFYPHIKSWSDSFVNVVTNRMDQDFFLGFFFGKAYRESRFNPAAFNPKDPSYGLFGMTRSTWGGLYSMPGADFSPPPASPADVGPVPVVAQIRSGAFLFDRIIKTFVKQIKWQPDRVVVLKGEHGARVHSAIAVVERFEEAVKVRLVDEVRPSAQIIAAIDQYWSRGNETLEPRDIDRACRILSVCFTQRREDYGYERFPLR